MATGEKRVSCSFCDEEHPSSAIGEHLMLCGNKTDQCPNCEKYIRRAIFAYHYENNCANLDEFEPETKPDVKRSEVKATVQQPDVRATVKQPEIQATFQPNYPPSSSSRPSARNDANTTVGEFDLSALHNQQSIPTSHQSNPAPLTNRVCWYCHHECDPRDYKQHEENCLQNPNNTKKRHEPQNNPIFHQNAAPLNYVNLANNNVYYPCKYCKKLILPQDYDNHTRLCWEQYYSQAQQQSQQTYVVDAPGTTRCRYCGKFYMTGSVGYHESFCPQNPAIIDLEARRRALYYPSSSNAMQY